jgi:hypothetical protein
MPVNPLKRTEQAIERIRRKAELHPETAIALQELVEVVRNIENRLSVLEAKGRINPTAEMSLPNRR